MTELERRALLGDKKAKQECTEKEIILPCPFCGGAAVCKTQKVEYGLSGTIIKCPRCLCSVFSPDTIAKSDGKKLVNQTVLNHTEIAISKWNTRPAPPIGRCGECASRYENEDGVYCCSRTDAECGDDDYCSYFEPRE